MFQAVVPSNGGKEFDFLEMAGEVPCFNDLVNFLDSSNVLSPKQKGQFILSLTDMICSHCSLKQEAICSIS